MILSICICSLERRVYRLKALKDHLEKQAQMHPGLVEILVETDNGESPTGTKRNKLFAQAQGEYVSCVDDDDWVADYYVDEIIKAVETKPDAVAINGIQLIDGRFHALWDISKYNPYITTRLRGRIHYLRFHNHLSPVKKEIAIKYPFPDISFAEDYAYAKAMHEANAIQTEVKIKKPMYEYRYRSLKKPNQ